MFILLDIDGVMVPAASWRPVELLSDGFPAFSPKAVESLNKIISETQASIILTTSHKSNYNIAKWRSIFSMRGINAPLTKLRTRSEHYQSRKDEVMQWLKAHKPLGNYIIIDDDKSLNDLPSEIKRHLILTSAMVGLNATLAEDVIRMYRQNILSAA